MNCRNCYKDNEESFKIFTCNFKGRRSLVVFLLNIVLNAQELRNEYCFCEKVLEECSVCQFRMLCWNDQYDLYENSFDLNFLLTFHDHMRRNLSKLLDIKDCHFACELINRQYFYSHKSWFDGQIEKFYIPYCLAIYENDKINTIKNNEFKVVLDPIVPKKYLFKK